MTQTEPYQQRRIIDSRFKDVEGWLSRAIPDVEVGSIEPYRMLKVGSVEPTFAFNPVE